MTNRTCRPWYVSPHTFMNVHDVHVVHCVHVCVCVVYMVKTGRRQQHNVDKLPRRAAVSDPIGRSNGQRVLSEHSTGHSARADEHRPLLHDLRRPEQCQTHGHVRRQGQHRMQPLEWQYSVVQLVSQTRLSILLFVCWIFVFLCRRVSWYSYQITHEGGIQYDESGAKCVKRWVWPEYNAKSTIFNPIIFNLNMFMSVRIKGRSRILLHFRSKYGSCQFKIDCRTVGFAQTKTLHPYMCGA